MGLLAAAVLLLLGLQDPHHRVSPPGPPDAADARHARNVLRGLEYIDASPDRRGELSGTIDEWNGLLRLMARSHPGLAAEAAIEDGVLRLSAEVEPGLPALPRRLSLHVIIPPFDGGLRVRTIRVGAVPLPAASIGGLAARLADRRLGAGTAETAVSTITGMSIEGDRVRLRVTLPSAADWRQTQALLTGAEGRSLPERAEVAEVVAEFVRRVEAGDLPRSGSFLPWLQGAVEVATDRADPDDPEAALLAVFLALDRMCGSGGLFRLLPGAEGAGRGALPAPNVCRGSLRGRGDLRQHFVTAATIRLLTSRGVAVTAGEAKELSDLGGSGFDFTDIAGNNSGIRFAALLSTTPPAEWPGVRAALRDEDDVMIRLQGLPGALSPAAFRTRFGEVNSPAYRAVVDEIEARIDRLPIHAGAAQGG